MDIMFFPAKEFQEFMAISLIAEVPLHNHLEEAVDAVVDGELEMQRRSAIQKW
jgi:hypothetical protein